VATTQDLTASTPFVSITGAGQVGIKEKLQTKLKDLFGG
jgi:hypothetical protein